jgi:hypothetical protein
MNDNSPTNKLLTKKKQKPIVRLHKNEAINSLLTATAVHWRLFDKQKVARKNNKKIEK